MRAVRCVAVCKSVLDKACDRYLRAER